MLLTVFYIFVLSFTWLVNSTLVYARLPKSRVQEILFFEFQLGNMTGLAVMVLTTTERCGRNHGQIETLANWLRMCHCFGKIKIKLCFATSFHKYWPLILRISKKKGYLEWTREASHDLSFSNHHIQRLF